MANKWDVAYLDFTADESTIDRILPEWLCYHIRWRHYRMPYPATLVDTEHSRASEFMRPTLTTRTFVASSVTSLNMTS